MGTKVLVLNAGSSSLKFKLFDKTACKLESVTGVLRSDELSIPRLSAATSSALNKAYFRRRCGTHRRRRELATDGYDTSVGREGDLQGFRNFDTCPVNLLNPRSFCRPPKMCRRASKTILQRSSWSCVFCTALRAKASTLLSQQ